MAYSEASLQGNNLGQNSLTQKIGNFRWRIVALLFFATTINYIDRNVLSFILLDDGFKHQMLGVDSGIPLTDAQLLDFKALMGKVDAFFKFAYAIGFIIMGTLIDKVGVRTGYAISIGLWVSSALSHAFVTGINGLKAARVGLGIGEAGNFPSAIKTVAEWFPKKERSKAVGIFNAGANIGIIATAFLVPYVASTYGWRYTFIATSCLGLMLFVAWLLVYRKPEEHPGLSATELAYIKADNEDPSAANEDSEPATKVTWGQILPFRQTWAFAIGKGLTDMVWWFYIFLLPTFFKEKAVFDLDMKKIGIPFLVIYLVSDLGSVAFGWLSSRLISKGWSANAARKITMLICALCVVPVIFAAFTQSIVVAIGVIALAAAAHQGWSANIFTTVTDMFPKKAVSSVTGFGGMMGAFGGMILAANYGALLRLDGNTYISLFGIASSAYLVALLIIHILVPKLEKAKL